MAYEGLCCGIGSEVGFYAWRDLQCSRSRQNSSLGFWRWTHSNEPNFALADTTWDGGSDKTAALAKEKINKGIECNRPLEKYFRK
jgi:hypothetical protein